MADLDLPQPSGTMRDDILYAAADLIAREGYGGCTMRAVAERVNIKAGSLYYHFSSKDQLIAEIMDSAVETMLLRLNETLEAVPEDARFTVRFRAMIRCHMMSKLAERSPLLAVYEHLPPVLKRLAGRKRSDYADIWMREVNRAFQNGEVRQDLNLRIYIPYLLTALNRMPEWYRPGLHHLETVIEEVITLELRAVGADLG